MQMTLMLRSMQNTRILADAKAENDALREMLVAVGCVISLSVSAWSTTASGVDNAALRLADTAERDYFTLREADH